MNRTNRRGQALVLSYMAVSMLTVMGAAFLTRALAAKQHALRHRLQTEVFYLAQGGLEQAVHDFAAGMANFDIDVNTDEEEVTTTFSASASFPAGVEVTSTVTAQGDQYTEQDPDGTNIFYRDYVITTTAAHPSNAAVTATVSQRISRRLIYTFQHAVFYGSDLEWHPGANMTLSGRVHSNSDMYLSAYNGKTLTVNSEYLKAAGDIYHARKETGSTLGTGTVAIKKADSSPAEYPSLAIDSNSATWTAESQTRWNGTVQSSVHGVASLAVPTVGSTEPDGYYNSNAGVVVENDTIYYNGAALTQGTDVPSGTISNSTTLYDQREAKYVKTTNIDLRKLAGYATQAEYDAGTPSFANKLPANGLLYATRDDAESTQKPGIRLVNGTEIERASGLTVVSNDPVYVQGTYNSTDRKPCAIIGDAVNLLSTAWSDTNSASSISSRVANSTTVNAAFMAGIKSTSGAQYSGGLENYPRLLEDWASKTLTITGAFVSLWDSQIATGNWPGTGTVYKAPVRTWSYDSSLFSSGSTLPPFTPFAIEIERGAWWKEE